MKIIVKNSLVEFQNYEPLLDVDVTMTVAGWQYFDLSDDVERLDVTKTIAIVPDGVTLTSIQVKPYVDGAIANAPVFLINQYNQENQVTNYSGKVISSIGVFAQADSFPVTFHIRMEKV